MFGYQDTSALTHTPCRPVPHPLFAVLYVPIWLAIGYISYTYYRMYVILSRYGNQAGGAKGAGSADQVCTSVCPP